ncbi:hypothetical protein PTTG_09258 [Puccinia triticina 1-1 BBBD Race 1]|uniref:Uncharacterized protein n=1 Tax=Puccinia triticina (isolate 1-1 / race 1 (BBBD)) TaxID=630390 RepID=A0A0C4F7X2_PUCT1|nr:hypothetical protein PTTG_09258 [Puccinia triticina 1-1 BBBD Race 1]
MSGNRTPNHPVHMTTLVEPLLDSVPENVRANQYGNVTTASFLQCSGVDGSDQRDFEVTLTTNTALTNVLEPGVVYYMTGKLIATNDGKTPTLTYNQHSVACVMQVTDEGFDFVNKASVEGLGIVIKREEVVVNLETRLEVIVEHTDWDSQEQRHKTFNIKYVVPGSKNFIKTHSLYVVGRELEIVGLMVDFDIMTKMAVVLVNDCSITSGHQIGRAKASGSSVKSNPHGKGRNLVKLSSDENTPSTITPASSPAKKILDTPTSSYCASDRNGKRKATEPTETDNEDNYDNGGGEDKDEEEEPQQKPTRGQPRKAILKDAAKRLKKL